MKLNTFRGNLTLVFFRQKLPNADTIQADATSIGNLRYPVSRAGNAIDL